MRSLSLALIALLALAAHAACAQSIPLYDGASGVTPDQKPWNWSYAQFPLAPNVGGTASGGVTSLDTTSSTVFKAGYALQTPFTLDNAAGYDITFDMQIVSEAHGSGDRAGCDIIVLGNDSRGVELGFWTDQVWAQTNAFTHATGTESAAFATTSALTHYDLRVQNNAYTLTANSVPLLSGGLHTYPFTPGTPYNQANFLFIGDDTTSASASFNLARVTAVPEPSALALFAASALTGVGVLRRRVRRAA